MIRKSLFLGLTLVLIAALAALMIQGRRMEKEQPPRQMEIVQQSKPTAIRVLEPQDMKIVQSKIQWEGDPQKPRTARHEIEIRNNGPVSYSGIQLRVTYLSGDGKALATRERYVAKDIPPGEVLRTDDITFGDLPPSTKHFHVTIDYGDLGSSPSRGE